MMSFQHHPSSSIIIISKPPHLPTSTIISIPYRRALLFSTTQNPAALPSVEPADEDDGFLDIYADLRPTSATASSIADIEALAITRRSASLPGPPLPTLPKSPSIFALDPGNQKCLSGSSMADLLPTSVSVVTSLLFSWLLPAIRELPKETSCCDNKGSGSGHSVNNGQTEHISPCRLVQLWSCGSKTVSHYRVSVYSAFMVSFLQQWKMRCLSTTLRSRRFRIT